MKRLAKFVAMSLAVTAAFFLFGFFVKLLWNEVIPSVTGWHALTYWQAVDLLILSKILFAGFRGGWGSPRRRRMLERYAQMSPEEQEKFREGMRWRCGPAQ